MPAAKNRMAADIVVRFDNDHRRPTLNRPDRRRQPRRPRTDHNHIRFQIPVAICCLCHRFFLHLKFRIDYNRENKNTTVVGTSVRLNRTRRDRNN